MAVDTLPPAPEGRDEWARTRGTLQPSLPQGPALPASLTCVKCPPGFNRFQPTEVAQWFGPPHTVGFCASHLSALRTGKR